MRPPRLKLWMMLAAVAVVCVFTAATRHHILQRLDRLRRESARLDERLARLQSARIEQAASPGRARLLLLVKVQRLQQELEQSSEWIRRLESDVTASSPERNQSRARVFLPHLTRTLDEAPNRSP